MTTRFFRSTITRLALALTLTLGLIASASAQRNATLKSSPGVIAAFRTIVATPSESTARIECDGKAVALGTIVDADGYVLTKASELRADPVVKLKDGRSFEATIVGIQEKHDLALLKIKAKDLKPVTWGKSKMAEPGDWVASAGTDENPVAIGVVSVKVRKPPTPRFPTSRPGGYLGVLLSADGDGLTIDQVTPNSGAFKAGMKAKDVILSVNGKKMTQRSDLLSFLSRTRPGQKVDVMIRRGEGDKKLAVTLGKRPNVSRGDIQNAMGSKLSERRTGFPSILQHDTVINPTDCGGPLINLDGKALGINIARAGRTESYAVPSDVVLALLPELKSGKLAPPTTVEKPEDTRTKAEKIKEAEAELERALESEAKAKSALEVARKSKRKIAIARAEDDLAKAKAQVAEARKTLSGLKK